MSRDKQIEIEEIVEVLIGGHHEMDVAWTNYFCDKKNPKPQPEHIILAEALYNAGYRRTADVAEEIFAEIEKEIELALDSNYKVKSDAQDDNDGLVIYVDGKIDCLRGLFDFIAELKKKYTERSENGKS